MKILLLISMFIPEPNFMALHTTEFRAYSHHSKLTVQAPNFCASLVSRKCLLKGSTHTPKQKFTSNRKNHFRLDECAELPAYVSADSLHTVSIAMSLGPVPILK